MGKTKKLMYMSLLVAMALVLHIVERNIPVPFITPGAKLGLANLVTVIALYTLANKWDIFKVISVRIILSALFGGPVSSLMYSMMGGSLSFLMMVVIKEIGKEEVSIIGVSVVGAVFHNMGQIIVACMILNNIGITLYLPVLSIVGIVTGVFIGMAANYTIEHMYKLSFFRSILNLNNRI